MENPMERMFVKHQDNCLVSNVVEFYSLHHEVVNGIVTPTVSVVKALFCKTCKSGVSGNPNIETGETLAT